MRMNLSHHSKKLMPLNKKVYIPQVQLDLLQDVQCPGGSHDEVGSGREENPIPAANMVTSIGHIYYTSITLAAVHDSLQDLLLRSLISSKF